MKKVIILGASGSIGHQTLDVMQHHPKDFCLVGFSLGHRLADLDNILKKNPLVEAVVIQNPDDCARLKKQYPLMRFYCEDDGLLSLLNDVHCDLVVNALVGFVGFLPTITALKLDINVALANKEALVVGGELINQLLAQGSAHLYPIDSEHVALAKCLKGQKQVERLILTASGGSFRELSRSQLKDVTKQDALRHPSWQMGDKITIDCATMMNKGFELMEAHHLFHLPMNKIDILMHDESQVHSLVEFSDNSYLADFGPSDMRIPISYALYGGKRHQGHFHQLDWSQMNAWHFHIFDANRYPCVGYARKAMEMGGTLPTALNAANEIAVQAFLHDEISFLQIEEIIKRIIDAHRIIDTPTVDDIVYVNKVTCQEARRLVEEMKK